MNKNVLIFLIFASCISNRNSYLSHNNKMDFIGYLINNKQCYWDPYYSYSNKMMGVGWFFISDKQMIEYQYNKLNQRIFLDYDDVIKDTMFWFVRNDTLVIDEFFKYKILKASNDSLELEDCLRLLGRDKILFRKSKDQITPIIKNKFSYLDSSDW